MKQEIQNFIDSLKNNYNFRLHSAKINGMQIDLFSCGVLLILRINQTIIHETLNRSYMRKILNEWKDGKRELKLYRDGMGLLIKTA
jgi:hypothetical protein